MGYKVIRLAGQRLTGQLDDPNLPYMGESLLPTTKHTDFDADPVERARQLALLPGGVQGPTRTQHSIKNYGGQYMPDGSQPTGYRPGPRRV